MTPTPAFASELAFQMALARQQRLDAVVRGDAAAAESAADRLADLEELARRHGPGSAPAAALDLAVL